LVRHLEEAGHEVGVITTRARGAAPIAGPGAVSNSAPSGAQSGAQSGAPNGAPNGATGSVFELRLPGVPVPVYPELLLPRWPRPRERRALDAFDPDVVHCATESVLGWWGRRWAIRSGRPLVTSFHTNFPAYAAGYGLGPAAGATWQLLRRFHEPALRTLAPSHETVADLAGHGFHPRLEVWSRGVDADHFHPARRSEALRERLAPGADTVILYVGRLAPEKRLALLLEAFPLVRARASTDVGLVLVGGGPMEADIRRAGHAGVHLAGYRTGLDLARAYASADLFAFPSDTETFGNVVLEAMASGLPVVGVDRGGVRDTIAHGVTGFRTPPGEVEPFAEAILDLVEHPFLRARMGTKARAEAEGRSWPRILDGVVDIYRETGGST
ncbi:MAG: glycosyltransferase family 1 protein, partial [Gemmatimonadales bacterium]